MYAVCCEFSGCKKDNFQINFMVICMLIKKINLQNVSFLCNCGGIAIIVTKIAYTYATIWSDIYNANIVSYI